MRAAASRALTLLARKKIYTSGTVAETRPALCSKCGVCVSICPYSAPSFIAADARMFAGRATVNAALCKGCGLCVAVCPKEVLEISKEESAMVIVYPTSGLMGEQIAAAAAGSQATDKKTVSIPPA